MSDLDPKRRCVGCFQEFSQKDLIRVVRTPKGEIEVQKPGMRKSIPGRGAYICANKRCLEKAIKTKGKSKSPLHYWLGVKVDEKILACIITNDDRSPSKLKS